jgi:hypothetical protein
MIKVESRKAYPCASILNCGDPVYLSSDGYWTRAASVSDAATTKTDATHTITQDAQANQTVEALSECNIDGFSGLTPGGLVYLTTSGTVSQTAPAMGYSQQILGKAVSATEIQFDVDPIPAESRTSLRIGNWVASGALGSAIPFAAAMDVYSDGQLDVVACFGESPANLTSSYSAKVGRFRHVINGITAGHETYGLIGQVVFRDATAGMMHAGLMGTFEVSSATTVNAAYPYAAACVTARLGCGTSLLTATTAISGFSSIRNGGALVSGNAFAYAMDSTSATTWTAALAVTKCDNLLYVATGTAYEAGVKVATQNAAGAYPKADGVIRMYVGATAYYIPFYAAGSIDNE